MSGALKNDKNPYKMHIIWWILFNGGQYIIILLYVCIYEKPIYIKYKNYYFTTNSVFLICSL
jgi:hypothetical protein